MQIEPRSFRISKKLQLLTKIEKLNQQKRLPLPIFTYRKCNYYFESYQV